MRCADMLMPLQFYGAGYKGCLQPCSQDGTIRQQLIERLMREIMNYDAKFRQDDRTGAIGSAARHETISAKTSDGIGVVSG
jgi:hypothetical protein